MDIGTLVEQIQRDGATTRAVRNPLSQFGPRDRPFLGATLLPERIVTSNYVRETAINYVSPIANSGTRYSPAQFKGGAYVGTMSAYLADSDIKGELHAQAYEELLRLIVSTGGTTISHEAMARVLNFLDLTVTRPLQILNEKQRWDAIVDAQVIRTGDNNFTETVDYSNPAGHRAAAGGVWSNNSYDPFTDIFAMIKLLRGKSLVPNRIITSANVAFKLMDNLLVKNRVGTIQIQAGTVIGIPGMLDRQDLNSLFVKNGIPPVETYDEQYATQTGSLRFLKNDVFVILCTTGRDQLIDPGQVNPFTLADTLGYEAIGIATGQIESGRVAFLHPRTTSKPPTIVSEGWQTSLPIIQDPEAIAVIHTIT